MDPNLQLAGAAAGGLLLGLLIAWIVLRSKHQAVQAAAVATAQAATQAALTEAQVKAQQAQATLDAKNEEFDRLNDEFHAQRNLLDTARDDVAKLTERASRVGTLEAQLTQAGAQLTGLQDQVTRLTGEANTHKTTAEGLAEKVPQLQRELAEAQAALTRANATLADTRQALGTAQANAEGLTSTVTQLRAELADATMARRQAESGLADAQARLAGLEQELKAERENAAEKIGLLTAAKEELSNQFKAIAGEILENNSKRFVQQNQDTLGNLLNPLREQLVGFQTKVEHVYNEENKDRASLKTEIANVMRMNQLLAEQANNLTTALRGSNKTQGNWGEMILERVLEDSGLRKGHEYIVQDYQQDDEGKRQFPDVVIQMPEGRSLVVDSKVTLVAFERFATAEDEASRESALKLHIESVRQHMKGLSDRRYEKLYGRSFDFVLMFVPIEPAFLAAVSSDASLYREAWEKNVLLVSPSTLLFVLRSVKNLWTQEARNKNAQDIADRGAELYDKLRLFAEELEEVGRHLGNAQGSFQKARERLATGKGNAIRQAEMLIALGVKATKQLPAKLTEMAASEDESPDLLAPTPAGKTGTGQTLSLLENDTAEAGAE